MSNEYLDISVFYSTVFFYGGKYVILQETILCSLTLSYFQSPYIPTHKIWQQFIDCTVGLALRI